MKIKHDFYNINYKRVKMKKKNHDNDYYGKKSKRSSSPVANK